MDDHKINPSSLANKIGVQRSTFSHLLSGRNKPSVDLLLKIIDAYPQYSLDYLVLGKEEGINPAPIKTDQKIKTVTDVTVDKTMVVLKPDGTYEEYVKAN